jgi:hypothetical protein
MTTWRAGQRITATTLQSMSVTDMATYTPTWGNVGSATFSTNTGYYYILGDMVFVNVYSVCNVSGSGAGIVTVTMPTNVDRTIRQALLVHAESVGVNGGGAFTTRGGQCAFFTSGSGAVADRLRVDDRDGDGESNLLGADITSTTGGSLINIQGWYRKA